MKKWTVVNGVEHGEVRDYIKKHKPINPNNIKKEDRKNLFKTACMIGDFKLVQKLIDLGESVSDPTLIENSSYYGFYDTVKVLLENGANPHGNGGALVISKYRNHKKVYNLLNMYMRKYKLNKIFKK